MKFTLFHLMPYGEIDWSFTDKNITDTIGVGLTYAAMPKKLDLGADLLFSKYRGEINYDNAPDFPELRSKLASLSLHGTYKLKKNLSARVAYVHEWYRGNDWSIDNLTVDSLPTVLGMGATTQEYDVNVIVGSLRYKFK